MSLTPPRARRLREHGDMLKTLRGEIEALGSILRMLALAAVAGAVYQELRRPPEERTWHGRLVGLVPYDFRVPSPGKLLRAWWNPQTDRLFSDPAFGVGWSLNLAAVADRVQGLRSGGPSSSQEGRRSRARRG